jgi:hypothetical protein
MHMLGEFYMPRPVRRIISRLRLADLCTNIPNLALTPFREFAAVNFGYFTFQNIMNHAFILRFQVIIFCVVKSPVSGEIMPEMLVIIFTYYV